MNVGFELSTTERMTREWAERYYKEVLGDNADCFTVIDPKTYGFTKVDDEAFSGWFRGSEIIFPEGIVYIGRGACQHMENLERVVFPSTLEYIDRNAFLYCEYLREVEFPEGLLKIDESAFELCHELKTVDIPGSVIEVGPCAFCHCRKLRRVRLHEGTEYLREKAFGLNRRIVFIPRLPATVIEEYVDENGIMRSVYEAFDNTTWSQSTLRKKWHFWHNRKKGTDIHRRNF